MLNPRSFLRSRNSVRASALAALTLLAIAGTSSHSIPSRGRTPAQVARPIVLVTGFDPFQGGRRNLSYEVAQALAELSTEYDFRACLVPTVYAKAENAAIECERALPASPRLVIGLGQQPDCAVTIETRARNHDDPDTADNDGVRRSGRIQRFGPKFRSLGLPADEMKQSLQGWERNHVNISKDAGDFVCNHYAYQMAARVDRGEIERFGFIHVAGPKCPATQNSAEASANLILKMLKATLPARDL